MATDSGSDDAILSQRFGDDEWSSTHWLLILVFDAANVCVFSRVFTVGFSNSVVCFGYLSQYVTVWENSRCMGCSSGCEDSFEQ